MDGSSIDGVNTTAVIWTGRYMDGRVVAFPPLNFHRRQC